MLTAITNTTIITMNAERSVMSRASLIIAEGLIDWIGPHDSLPNRPFDQIIDGSRAVVMPGMVDLHAKAGHAIIRSLGEHLDAQELRTVWDDIATRYATEQFFYVDAQLGAAEKLLNGTTAIISSPGAAQSRMGDPVYIRQVHRAMEDVGIRARLIAGIGRAPWPQTHVDYKDGKGSEVEVGFEQSLENIESVIATAKTSPSGLVDYVTGASRIGNPNPIDPVFNEDQQRYLRVQFERLSEIMKRYDVGFFANGYGNSVEFAYDNDLGILTERTILSHGTSLSDRALDILQETGTSISHNPRTRRIYEYEGSCRVVEMLEAGITVGLGSDGPAPDRRCDQFATLRAGMKHQRQRFRSHHYLPPGKALEMATIDGYKALGMDAVLGSLEPGKKADLIVIDMSKPHLWPTPTPVQQIAYFATGSDVSHVFVEGMHVVKDGKLTTVDTTALMQEATEELERLMGYSELGLQDLATIDPGFGQVKRHFD